MRRRAGLAPQTRHFDDCAFEVVELLLLTPAIDLTAQKGEAQPLIECD
jgi:hypothetical protein